MFLLDHISVLGLIGHVSLLDSKYQHIVIKTGGDSGIHTKVLDSVP